MTSGMLNETRCGRFFDGWLDQEFFVKPPSFVLCWMYLEDHPT